MSQASRRVVDHPVLGPAPRRADVSFTFDGQVLTAMEGEVIAAALLAHGIRTLGTRDRGQTPRGLYCAIGHCFECQVTVDGRTGARACLMPVREGMQVSSAPVARDAAPGGNLP